MLLFEPPPTQGDIHFRAFGIPVRVHPFFWFTTIIMGLNPKGGTPPAEILIWVGVVFVSILVHELGHAFAQRRYGGHPWITLHGMGGLASCDDCDRRPASQIVISLAGPLAGFILAALVVCVVKATGWPSLILPFETPDRELWQGVNPAGFSLGQFAIVWQEFAAPAANALLNDLLWVNIGWGLINLLPIYPLDGGRVSRELCTLRSARQGIVLSLRISLVCAAVMAGIALLMWESLFSAMLFGYLAFTNYQTLAAYQRSYW